MRVRIAGAVLTVSGAVTIALSVFLAVVLFILAVVPLLVGVVQARAGIAAMLRTERGGMQLAAAGIGFLVGVLHLPGSTFNPDGEGLWTVLGLTLIAANAAAGFVFVQQGTLGQGPDSN